MKNLNWRGVVWVFLALNPLPSYSSDDASGLIHLDTYKTHSRITFHIDSSVPVRWKNSIQGFELELKGISLTDLGAPLGEEEAWKKNYRTLRDTRLASLQLSESSGGVLIQGKWKYPTGRSTLAFPGMEYFDYREKTPSQYVVDFWPKPGPTVSELEVQKQKEKMIAAIQKMKEDEKKRSDRRIASEKNRADIKNSALFCSQPLTEQNEIFLKFNPIHQKVDFSHWFPSTTADSDYPYFEPLGPEKDAQYVRLVLKLYAGGNVALALKALDFFNNEFPGSRFHTEMRFLRANGLIKLGHHASAEKILKLLMKDASSKPVALHSAMYLSQSLMAKQSPLLALDNFLWLIEHYGDYSLNWVFHLGVAECLYALGQAERAAKEYRWVMDKAPDGESRAQAAFRMGDLHLIRFQYEQALATYYQGRSGFEAYQKRFPTFYLNHGETLYQLGQYDRAKAEFEEFLRLFPNHSAGWRATFRLAEIEGRNPKGNGQESPEFRKILYSTVNRYPLSPGATLARLRLIPCGDHGEFTYELSEQFFREEAESFDGRGEIFLKAYPDFRALAHIRGLITLGTADQIATLAAREYKKTTNPSLRKTLNVVANNFFQKMIIDMLRSGKKYEAIRTFLSKSASMPPLDEEADPTYMLKLSEAASDLEMGRLANQFLAAYKRGLQVKEKFISTQKNVGEPKDLEYNLSVYEQNFAAAKALWIATRSLPKEQSRNEDIKHLLLNVKGESKYAYEKELILGLIDESDGNIRGAIEHVSSAKLLEKSIRLDAWLAALEIKAGDTAIGYDLYVSLEKQIRENRISILVDQKKDQISEQEHEDQVLGVPSIPSIEKVIISQAQILEGNGKWKEASNAYSRILEQSPQPNRVLFSYARSLTKTGDPKERLKAIEAFKKIAKTESKDESETFWKNLALEALANEETKESIIENAKEGKI